MDNSTDNLILEESDEKCYFWLLTLVYWGIFLRRSENGIPFNLIAAYTQKQLIYYSKTLFFLHYPIKIYVGESKWNVKKEKKSEKSHVILEVELFNVPLPGFT